MSDTQAKRPVVYPGSRFLIEARGITEGLFSECSGLQAETEIFEWEEGGLNEYRHRLPGRVKYTNLVLKRGVALKDLWEWYLDTARGTITRKQLSIVLYSYQGEPEMRWNIDGALPIKWVG